MSHSIREILTLRATGLAFMLSLASAPAVAQTPDAAFTATADGVTTQSAGVRTVSLQSDGKILIGGNFDQVNGVSRTKLARLNANGSLDTAFPTTVDSSGNGVYKIVALSDGRILVGGHFTELAGIPHTRVARLLADGTGDTTFTPEMPNGDVRDIAPQPDGRIIIGGSFSNISGVYQPRLARLNIDGSLDPAFTPSVNDRVHCVIRQPNGQIVIGGVFTAVNGVPRSQLARLNADGSLDPAFNPSVAGPSSTGVYAMALQDDGRIVVGGDFLEIDGVSRLRLARLLSTGQLDTAFNTPVTGAAFPTVESLAIQPDGRLLIGGYFDAVGGIDTYALARVMPDGAFDFTFGSASDGYRIDEIKAIAVQPDGGILAGGRFNAAVGNISRQLRDATPPYSSDLSLALSDSPDPVATGGTLTYRITVTNPGPNTAWGVTVSDTLPAGLAFLSCTATGGACGGTGNARTVTYPQIAPGSTHEVVLRATVTAAGGAILTNPASLASVSPDGSPANNTASAITHVVDTLLADIEVTQTASNDLVETGDTLVWTVTVANIGTAAAQDVLFTDTLPGGVSLTSCVVSGGGACVTGGGLAQAVLASVTAGATRTITVTATVTAAGITLIHQPAATSTNDAFTANNTASLSVVIGDADSDGLANEWEVRFGLNPRSAAGHDGGGGDPDGDGATNAQEQTGGTHPRGFFSRFLPEGARNEFFDARFAVLNVGNAPGRLWFRFLQSDGDVLSHFIELPQNRRITIDGTILSQLTTPDFSTALESDQPIVLDRTMTWANGLGSHAETGVQTPATTWYLAEGATAGDFSLFYLLQNPNPTETVATVKYLLPDGLAPITKTYPLAANSRTTIFVDVEDPRLAETALSAVITTPGGSPIIVERAMYRSTPTQDFAAGHGSSGVTATATSWFFAEGATGPFFDCFILLANPGSQPATVTINYLLDDGRTFTKGYTVPAEGRYTVYVDAEEIPAGSGVRPLDTVAVSSTVESDQPIIAERAMWWPGPAMGGEVWTEAHNSPGATVTGTRWALAEGEVAGPQAAETYILIANTSEAAGSARVTLYFADGTSAVQTFPLLPRSRRNVNVSADYPERATLTFSAVIESLAVGGNPAAQVVVERAMYTSPNGLTWAAGTNALATRLNP